MIITRLWLIAAHGRVVVARDARHRSSRRKESNVANAVRFLPNCTTILDQRRLKYKQPRPSGDTLGDDDSEGVRCRRIVVVSGHSSR